MSRPAADELFADYLADPSGFAPTLYVTTSRNGLCGPGLPPVDLTPQTKWRSVVEAIAASMDAPGPVMVRLLRPGKPPAERWHGWSADVEISAAFFDSQHRAPSSPQPQPPSITVSADPMATARALVADAEERSQRMLNLVLSTLKEERQALAPRSAASGLDAESARNLGRLEAQVEALKNAPPADGTATLAAALASPVGLTLMDRLLKVGERYVRSLEVKAEAESTMADAELARAAAAAGLPVEEGAAAAAVPDDVEVNA